MCLQKKEKLEHNNFHRVFLLTIISIVACPKSEVWERLREGIREVWALWHHCFVYVNPIGRGKNITISFSIVYVWTHTNIRNCAYIHTNTIIYSHDIHSLKHIHPRAFFLYPVDVVITALVNFSQFDSFIYINPFRITFNTTCVFFLTHTKK